VSVKCNVAAGMDGPKQAAVDLGAVTNLCRVIPGGFESLSRGFANVSRQSRKINHHFIDHTYSTTVGGVMLVMNTTIARIGRVLPYK
jgi:hypothetical protein